MNTTRWFGTNENDGSERTEALLRLDRFAGFRGGDVEELIHQQDEAGECRFELTVHEREAYIRAIQGHSNKVAIDDDTMFGDVDFAEFGLLSPEEDCYSTATVIAVAPAAECCLQLATYEKANERTKERTNEATYKCYGRTDERTKERTEWNDGPELERGDERRTKRTRLKEQNERVIGTNETQQTNERTNERTTE